MYFLFIWLMMYLFVYVRGRHYILCFIVSYFTYVTLVIDLYYKVIRDICLLFSVL